MSCVLPFADSAKGSNDRSVLRREFVLGPQLEVAGVVALVQLVGGIALQAVDDPPALDGRALADRIGPALDVAVLCHRQELAGAVEQSLGESAVPRPHRDIGDRVAVARQVLALAK